MAQSPEEFFRQLCTEAGFDETQTAQALQLAKHDKLSPKLAEIIRRGTDDFNAMQGRVRAADAKVAGYDAWYQDANTKFNATVAELERLRAAGNGNPNPAPPTPTNPGFTREEVIAMLNERDGRVAGAMKEVGFIASQHAAMFGEALDVDSIEQLALKNKLSITEAYNKFVEPRVTERNKKAQEERDRKLQEDAVREYASKHNLPADPVPTQRSFIVDAPTEKPKGGTTAELVDLWNKVGSEKAAHGY